MRTLEDYITDEAVPTQPQEEEKAESKVTVEFTEGFIIKEIEMKGFMRYIEKTSPPITFPNKFTVITGKTGTGKTSILDAITFTLYKRTSRTDIQNIKISDVCRPGGFVKVSFTQNGEDYQVERGFSSSGTPYLNLKKDGKFIDGKIKEKERIIQDIIGLDYDGFRNSTFVRQEEMKELGAQSAAERLDIFQKLFRLETFEKAQTLVSSRLDGVKKKASRLETEINVRSEQMAKLSVLEEELAQKNEYNRNEKEKLKELNRNFEDLNLQLKVLSEKHDEYSAQKGKLESIKDRLNKTEKRLLASQKDAKNLAPLRKEIAALEGQIKDYETLRSEGENLKEKQRSYQTIIREQDRDRRLKESLIKEREIEITRLKERIEKSEARIANLSTEIGKDEAFAMLRMEGTLTERVDRIEKEIQWLKEKKELIKELKSERGEANRELKVIIEKTQNINEDSFVLSEIETGMEQMKRDIAKQNENYQKKIGEIEGKVIVGEEKLKELGFGEEERKKIATIRDKVSKMQNKKKALEEKRKKLDEIGDLSSLIDDLKSQKNGLGDELKGLEKRLSRLKVEEENYKKAKNTFEKIRKDKEELYGMISKQEGEAKRLENQIKELKDLKMRVQETKIRLKELKEKSEIYSILREKVFHKRGIVMYAIDQLLPQLSLETSTNLSEMTDGRFSKVRLASYQENNRYGIRIEVSGADGKWHDVQEFSGGEKTQINAALRFAIAKELASMPRVGRTYGRMKTLFIDEGDLGSLDTESSRQLFVKKLFDMGEFFEKIILITHLTEVAERFPGRIMVYMTPEEESRIKVMA